MLEQKGTEALPFPSPSSSADSMTRKFRKAFGNENRPTHPCSSACVSCCASNRSPSPGQKGSRLPWKAVQSSYGLLSLFLNCGKIHIVGCLLLESVTRSNTPGGCTLKQSPHRSFHGVGGGFTWTGSSCLYQAEAPGSCREEGVLRSSPARVYPPLPPRYTHGHRWAAHWFVLNERTWEKVQEQD